MQGKFGFISGMLLTAATPLAAQPPAKLVPAKSETVLLEAVGTVTAANLYQAYLNIGFLADGKAEGTYNEKDAAEVLASIVSLLKSVDQQLDKLVKLDLPKDDREALEQLRKISTLLHQEADELSAYWKTGDQKRGDQYEKLRQEAWQAISKRLGIQ